MKPRAGHLGIARMLIYSLFVIALVIVSWGSTCPGSETIHSNEIHIFPNTLTVT